MLLAIEIIVMKSTVHSSAGGKTPNNIIIDIRYASYRENMKFPIHSFTTRYVYGEKPRFWEKLNIQQQQPGHHDTKLKTETQKRANIRRKLLLQHANGVWRRHSPLLTRTRCSRRRHVLLRVRLVGCTIWG